MGKGEEFDDEKLERIAKLLAKRYTEVKSYLPGELKSVDEFNYNTEKFYAEAEESQKALAKAKIKKRGATGSQSKRTLPTSTAKKKKAKVSVSKPVSSQEEQASIDPTKSTTSRPRKAKTETPKSTVTARQEVGQSTSQLPTHTLQLEPISEEQHKRYTKLEAIAVDHRKGVGRELTKDEDDERLKTKSALARNYRKRKKML